MLKSPQHADAVRYCFEALEACLPAEMFLMKEDPITTARSEAEPDISVIKGGRRDYRGQHPNTAVLVIEVAVSTVHKDRSKAAIYSEAGVREYWLIEPETKRVTVYRLPEITGYRERITYAGKTSVASAVLPGFQLCLSGLFLPMP